MDDLIYIEDHRTMTNDEILDRVKYHPPSEHGAERHKELIAIFSDVMKSVDYIVPGGREKSIVMTKLEEAKMWASAGIARNPDTV